MLAESKELPSPENFSLTAIPEPHTRVTALDYHDVEIDFHSEFFNEPLVNCSDLNLVCHSYYFRKDGFNPPYYRSFSSALENVYLRKTAAEKLVSVNETLEPLGLELCLIDGYRPIQLQTELWQHFLNRARQILNNPAEHECIAYAGHYCSNPDGFDEDNFRTWPVHTTGGAIDLLLRIRKSGEYLFQGSVFDDSDKISFTNYFEKFEPETTSDFEARKNRRILYWAMVREGFINYPCEWWHFDLGTQLWALNHPVKNTKAFYGYIAPPPEV